MTNTPATTRMAPSPTGNLHIGTAHTTMFNYLLAKQTNGQFILRIDDTDAARNRPEFEADILDSLRWLGLDWDQGGDLPDGPHHPYHQSQRTEIYQTYIDQLLDSGHAYRCFCTSEQLAAERAASQARKEPVYQYSGICRQLTANQIKTNLDKNIPYTIRMRTDFVHTIVVDDLIRGHIEIPASEIGDFVITRSDGSPILLLTSTVDDIEMGVTHAFRGEDMLNVTFRMFFIYQALNKPMPHYGHKPFLYAADGKKLSKRHGATSITEFRQAGYLPAAILNYLLFVGYTPSDDQKPLWTKDEMITDFDISRFQKGMPRFDYKKLLWYNSQYIKQTPDAELVELLTPYLPAADKQMIKQLVPLVKQRIKTLAEVTDMTSFLFTDTIQVPDSGWKQLAIEHLTGAIEIFNSSEFKLETINLKLERLITDNDWKTGHFFMNLRLAVSGQTITPPITESILILGPNQTLTRIQNAINYLKTK